MMSGQSVHPAAVPVCPPAVPRRRGETLENAIFQAVLDQLATVGYDGLTMEGVAAGAQTGKASLYRRWPSKEDLVVAAMDHAMPSLDDPPDTGTVRGDLLDLLGRMACMINSRTGCAMQGLLLSGPQRDCDSMRAVRTRVIQPRQRMILAALQRGIDRGEVRPAALSRLVAEVGPALLVARVLLEGSPIQAATVEAIVDDILLPLVRA